MLSASISSASASVIGHNSDLLVDILHRLPAKSLSAFKIVSKQWQCVISDPYFEKTYNLRNRCRRLSMPALLMKKRIFEPNWMESDFETLVIDEQNSTDNVTFNTPIAFYCNTRIDFEQSCNGLVLYKVHYGPNASQTPYHVIYNPSTRHCKTLPFRKTDVPYFRSLTIAFDPAKSSYYEVVGVSKIGARKDVYHFEIYSSNTDSWRAVGDPFTLSPFDALPVSGVYWNGSVYWIDKFSRTIHYFDVDCELMKRIAVPKKTYPNGDSTRRIVYFSECRGHIHLVEMRKGDMPCYDIWEMRKDYTGWNVKYCVDLTPLRNLYPGIVQEDRDISSHRLELHVLLVEEGEDSSRLIVWIAKDRVIISIDLKKRSVKKMHDVNPDVWVNGFEYIETLDHHA